MWYSTFDGIFFITMLTIITTFLGVILKYCLKSKCDHIDICFGCLKIERNVQLEQEEEMKAMELGIRTESSRNLNESPTLKLPIRQITNDEHKNNIR
jgi:hypothetical protein